MPETDFVHLHTHSHYSLLDCTATPGKLAKAARKAGMKALALTDHGNMFGAVEFYEKALKAGIKPIVGYEAYVAPESRKSRQAKGIRDAAFHLTLLAQNETGYHNLMHLSSIAYTEGFYYKPRIDREVLGKYNEGIVCLSGCLSGELSHNLLIDEPQRAEEIADEYRQLFPDGRFFIEIQDHGIEEQRRILPGLISLAKKLGLPLVATNDIHYIDRDDCEAHDALLCINTGKLISDKNRMRFTGSEFYFKSGAEMLALFPDNPEAISNSVAIAEMCNLEMRFGEMHFPKFEPPGGLSPEQYLGELCEEGFARYYPADDKAARARLERELELICRMGFASYFLIVNDFVRFAVEKDIPVGPGRGSAAGSLVSYCLGITKIDPLKYELLFERFLDENRREMPDIDIDFCMEKRDQVIEYVKNKYGEDRVAQIITFGTMAAKGVVRDVGRVLGVPLSEVNRLCALIPSTLGTTLESAFKAVDELQKICDADPQIAKLFEIGRRLEGLARHPSVHAAGVVISDEPLEEYVPLYSTEGERITQYPMDILPKVGLLKMDFLGLRTLTIIRRTTDLVRDGRGVEIDIDRIPLDDKRTFEMLAKGGSTGVFQFESSGIRDLLRRLKPDKFSDLIACVALYRPGPLGGGMVDDFVNRKQGRAKIEHIHPSLQHILEDTYGVMAYQEQVMKILNELGGMPMADALTCIKAISKKKVEVIEQYRESFLRGALGNGVEAAKAEEIFNLITFFGGYGFNRAHSTAYAMLSYQTAYLKANWPVEFFAATFTFEMGDTDKLSTFVTDAPSMGIKVLGPDVNESDADFTPTRTEDGKDAIRYGLAALKGVGHKAAEAIMEGRRESGPFTSIYHFAESVDIRQMNKTVLEVLIMAGACDCLGARRSQMAGVVSEVLEAAGVAQSDRRAGQATFFGAQDDVEQEAATAALPKLQEWSQSILVQNERMALGFSLEGSPHKEKIAIYCTVALKDLHSVSDGQEVIAGGTLSSIRPTTIKNGRNKGEAMAAFTINDGTADADAVIFPDEYRRFHEFIENNRTVMLKGRADLRREAPQIKVSEVIPIERADEKLAGRVVVTLTAAEADPETLEKMAAIFKKHPGRLPVYLELATPKAKVLVATGGDYRVDASKDLVRECSQLLGEGHVAFVGSNGGSRR